MIKKLKRNIVEEVIKKYKTDIEYQNQVWGKILDKSEIKKMSESYVKNEKLENIIEN